MHLYKRASRLPPEQPFDLKEVKILEDAIASIPNLRMVVIDPIGSFLGKEIDSFKDNEVRSVLAPIAAAAERRCRGTG